MRINKLQAETKVEALVRVPVHMYPTQRDKLRVLAAAHKMSMSGYIKSLIDQEMKRVVG
jgi:hypothetical protein